MKKLVSILLVMAMMFSLAACGGTKEETSAYSQIINKDGYYDIKASDYVTLPEFEGIAIPDDVRNASEETIKTQIDGLLSSHSTTKEVTNRAIEFGDSVNIDYSGAVDGEKFDGGTATGQTVTAGGTNFIDDFLTQIIGHKPGETFDIEVTFPDEYQNNPDLAGKDAIFTITVNFINETVLPELNDAFVKENFSEQYSLNTVDDLKEYVANSISEQQMRNYVDEYLFDNSTFTGTIPEDVIEHQKLCVKANYDDMAASYGLDVETLISYYGYSTLDELIEGSADDIEQMAKDVLIYQAIAEKLGKKVSNEDVADYFEEVSGTREYSGSKDHYGLPYLKMMVMDNRIIEYLIEKSI